MRSHLSRAANILALCCALVSCGGGSDDAEQVDSAVDWSAPSTNQPGEIDAPHCVVAVDDTQFDQVSVTKHTMRNWPESSPDRRTMVRTASTDHR